MSARGSRAIAWDRAVVWIGCAGLFTLGCGPNGYPAAPIDGGGEASIAADGGAGGDGASSGDGATPGDDGSTPVPDGGFAPPTGVPSTVLLDGAQLAAVQHQLAGGSGGSAEQKAALQNLLAAAGDALAAGTWTVTSKPAMYVVNNDAHEYVSWGPYWWPPDAVPPGMPGTVSTCPYVQHDGIRNPNVDQITDRHALHASSEAIFELALAWYFTGNPAYADQAERVARAFFLDTATAMNPDMAYGQEHGPCGAGNAAGLIEASGGYLTDALDGLAILALDSRPKGWTAADQTGIQTWMMKFLTWVQTSTIGKGEQAALNNHGTWYDALVASILVYTGDMASAKTLVTSSQTSRIDSQIMADGSQPQELSRTTSWHYANFNAAGLCRLAGTAQHVGVDLWSYQSAAGGSIGKAIDFMLPTATTATPPGPWATYNDITSPFDAVYQAEAYYTIRAAAEYAKDPQAQAVLAQSPIPVQVPGHHCSGDRFPTGSDFCGITSGTMAFADLQGMGTAAVDMWPLIPTCRVPIN
jgi:hypothetical protein